MVKENFTMTKNQYENIIETTVKNESADKGGLDTVRTILKNLGIGFPKGDAKEIRAALETEDFMGWEKCDGKEAEEALENGTPVIAVTGDKVFVVTGERGGTDLTNSSVTTQEELKKLPGVQMYVYSGETTEDYPAAPHFSNPVVIQSNSTGKYLAVSNGHLTLISSPAALLGDNAKWRLVYQGGGDTCFIIPKSDFSKRLCVDNNYDIYLENSSTSGNKAIRWEILIPSTFSSNYYIRNFKKRIFVCGSVASSPYASVTPDIYSEWAICDESVTTSLTLPMNCNINQKYHLNDVNMIRWGCCVCACCDVASFYHGSAYTLADMATAGVYDPCDPGDIYGSTGDVTCIYSNVPSADFSSEISVPITGQAQARATIKEELIAGRPVVIKTGTASGHEHYVVAYGYVNNATSNSDIMVLDPCNLNPSFTHPQYGVPASYNPNGQDMTLAASLTEQGNYYGVTYYITALIKTSAEE